MEKKTHILMTGAGAPGAPGIIRCLLEDPSIELTVADADPEAAGRWIHSRFESVPKGDDPQFIPRLLHLCTIAGVNLVLPLVTKELLPLARARASFEKEGIRVLVSPENAIATANDKGRAYSTLHDAGIEVPRHFIVSTTEAFIHAAFELGHPSRPFCFKPTLANGSRGFRIVSDSINESEQLFGQKPYNTYITYPHALKILSSQAFPELLVTEYLPGEEYSVDCVAREGKTLLAVPRLRERMVNGISVKGRFVKDEAIIDYCTRIISALGLHGNIGIQVRRNEAGIPLLLEVNPRVQGTIVAALGAGVNLPLLAMHGELGRETGKAQWEVKWGTRFSRYWTEVYY